MIELRGYQREAIECVMRDWRKHKAVLVVMATGLGKTAVFLSLLHEALSGTEKRALVIAHRKELIDQPVDRLLSYYPEWAGKVGVVMAEQDDPGKQITVATVQSLAMSARRLERILENGAIDYMVTDEAHHATDKNSYNQVLERLYAANPEMRHVGVTATPMRSDGDGLRGVFEKCAFKYGIVDGIKHGYLSPVRFLAIQTSISLAEVRTTGGDFVQKQLANVFETDNCFDLVVETHRQYALGRQAAAYTVSVEGAYRLAEKFNEAGIPAAAADGTTDKRSRGQILQDFRDGRTQVLVNVGLYTEGLDVPQISCIHQVRPTKSDTLYTQIIGRALRIAPECGKTDALVLDYAPADVRNIAMLGDVLGVPLKRETYMQETEEPGMVQGGFVFDGEFSYIEGSPAEIITRKLNYLEVSPWSWKMGENGWMVLGLGKAADEINRSMAISPPDDDGMMHLYGVIYPDGKPEQMRCLGSGSFAELQEIAESKCRQYASPALSQKEQQWRTRPPSEKQIRYARFLHCWKAGMSMGELQQAIEHAKTMRSLRRNGVPV